MALSNKRKERYRQVIRTTMIAVAVFLLVVALAIPVANNAVALGEENRLKDLPLPDGAQLVDSVSAAGDLTNTHNGMQYFGAVMIQSDLSKDEIVAHYVDYRNGLMDCIVVDAEETKTLLNSLDFNKESSLFNPETIEENWYMVYSWGNPPGWLWDILNMDSRAR